MISSVNSFSSNSISLLFGTSAATRPGQTGSEAEQPLDAPTGNTDNLFKAGNAIGKIIEIVAGMNAADTGTSAGMFNMEGAVRAEGEDGEYTLTKTGKGRASADGHYADRAMASLKERAAGSGAAAEWARTYIDALAKGTVTQYDMSTMGVTSTMTEKQTFNADGSMKGSSTSWDTKGMDAFLSNHVEIRDGVMYDKATGKHSTIAQNGTVFTYSVW